MHDVLIRNALVLDGNDRPGRHGDVAVRDGRIVAVGTEAKVSLIQACYDAGLRRMEVGSFVSPKAIPALRDGEQVFQGIQRKAGVIYVALIPNLKGAQRAVESRADELNLVMSASQTHNLANMRMRRSRR